LAPEQKCEVLAEALAAAKTVDTEVPRARAIGLLARHLVPEQKFEALAYALAGAKAIGNERFRAEALGSLAPYILPIQYIDLITSLIEVAARLPRSEALSAITVSAHISRALGSVETVEAIHSAINDTARWYPQLARKAAAVSSFGL